ncbi:bestrophin family protein [Paraburkholderia atlantica]|uniref:bestrophin family protein n=1 Tax=Paraburkholderia atlantica TaxID=2654982 RepID=UPI001609CCC8|nr:bestrophin family ion channel [Paraburkholderia atlantica]
MILMPKQNWFRLLFVWNDGSVLRSISPQLFLMAIVSSVAVATHGRIFGAKIPLNKTPFTLFGLTLAIFLAFRNNASYQRFDEARRLWGDMLISARELTSQIICYVPASTDKIALAHSLVAFVYSLKHRLRGTDSSADLIRLLERARTEPLRKRRYQPVALLNAIRCELADLQSRGLASGTQLWMFDLQLNELGKSVGGCERIASTPIPFAYNVLLHRTVYTYCVLLPFGLVDSTEFFTPLLCVFISYTLIALEAIASEVAEPFSFAQNALALDAITRNIERSVLELCDRELPDEIEPIRPYLFT